jgi:hypothetical protein
MKIMKQSLIFVVILLVTLSMVNAIPHQLQQLHKRVTTFSACPSGSPNSLTVTLQPDPPVAGQPEIFTISGTIDTGTLDVGSSITIQALDDGGKPIGTVYRYRLCEQPGSKCPYSSFSTIIRVPMGSPLPTTYTILVQLFDAAGSLLGCSMGTITGA